MKTRIPITTAITQENFIDLSLIRERKEKSAGVHLSFSQVAARAVSLGIQQMKDED